MREAGPGAERTLFEFAWTPASAPTGKTSGMFPAVPVHAWAWLQAQRLTTLGDGDRAAILALLHQVGAAIERGDHDWLIAHQTMQISEQAMAAGANPSELLHEYATFLAERGAMTVDPINPALIKMELMGGGRVVQVTRKDGRPPLFARGANGIFAMMPYLAKIAGAWQIVR